MVLSEHSVAIPKSISWSSFYLLKFQRHPHYIFSFFSGSLKSKEVLRLCESNGWVGFWWLVSTIISTTLYILMGWWYRYLIIDTYLLLRITHRLNSIHLTHDSNFSGSSTTSIWDSKDWLHHSNHVLLPENSQKSDSNGQFTRNFNFMHLFKGLGVFVFPPWACRFTKKKTYPTVTEPGLDVYFGEGHRQDPRELPAVERRSGFGRLEDHVWRQRHRHRELGSWMKW